MSVTSLRPTDDLRVPVGARTLVIAGDEFAGWIDEALHGVTPVNRRRDGLKGLVQRDLLRRTDRDDVWERSPELRAAVAKAWPMQQPIRLVDKLLPGPGGKRRQWTVADQFLVDEANSMLNGTPFTFGHVVVDEAQDHSAVSLRVHRPAQPARLDDDPRRPRPVHDARRPAGLERSAGLTSEPTPPRSPC